LLKSVIFRALPEIAVPMTVKMPEPMTAPIPSAVSDHGPSVFLRQFSGFSESRISLSIDLRDSNWLASGKLLAWDFACRRLLVESSLPNNTGPATTGQDWKRLPQNLRSLFPASPWRYLRLDCPRAAFFNFCLFSPRAPVRGPCGAAFLRAARLSFLRSSTSSTALVFAIFFSFPVV
jgi:hypothetical protein